jgi:hypothetical protein
MVLGLCYVLKADSSQGYHRQGSSGWRTIQDTSVMSASILLH